MKPNQTDLVGEYLHEVDLRLSGLPLLQRRELLADLAAHIATERTERNAQSEGELIEILERLGSPEVVAAAAYEEAGGPRPAATPPPFTTATPAGPQAPFAPPPFAVPSGSAARKRTIWIFAALAGVGVVLVLCLGTVFAAARTDGPSQPFDGPPQPASTAEYATPADPTSAGAPPSAGVAPSAPRTP